jgi:hypothetical protein
MDEDPSNEAFVLSLLEGYGADEAKAMETEPVPRAEDKRAKYLAWIDRGELPSDRSEARRIARMAKSFTTIDGELYKHAASGILQQCIAIPHSRELIRDIHAGVCGHHAAPHTLVGNAVRQGFYWPTAVADANEVVRTCEGCQFYTRKTNLLAHALQTIPVTWLFAAWGWTLSGPCERCPGATPTYWSSWTNSQNGSRYAQSRTSGQMLTVDFGTPSYKFTVNIFTYLIF